MSRHIHSLYGGPFDGHIFSLSERPPFFALRGILYRCTDRRDSRGRRIYEIHQQEAAA